MKKITFIEVAGVVLTAVCLILLCTVCAPCPTGMICRNTTTHIVALMIVSLATYTTIMCRDIKCKHYTALIRIFLLLVMCALIGIEGGCKVYTMRCWMITYPTIFVFSLILIVLNVVIFCLCRKQLKTDKR